MTTEESASDEQPETGEACPACGAEAGADARSCTECGAPMLTGPEDDGSTASPITPAADPGTEPTTPVTPTEVPQPPAVSDQPQTPPPSQPGWGAPAGIPPVVPAGQPPTPGMPQQVAPGGYPAQYPPAAPTNSSAIAALVCGILGLTACPVVLSIVALVLGYSAKKTIRASGGREQGGGMATAGIVTGWIGIAIWGALLGFYLVLVVIAVLAGSGSSGI